MIFDNQNAQTDTDSGAVTPSDLREFTDEHQKQITAQVVQGNETKADLHRVRVGLALWSLAINNRKHDHSQTFYDRAYNWTRDHLLEVDLQRLADQSAAQSDAAGQGEGSAADTAAEADHTATDDDPSPAERAASEVLDRVRDPERSLDELHGEQLHEELDDVIDSLELALDLNNHPAFDNRNIGNVLFTGPPGTGKTTAAEGVANILSEGDYEFQFLPIKGHHFKNHLLGASEGAVEEIFQQADSMGPTLIFIDEFEEVATREGDRHEVTQAITNTLLSLLSGGQAVENVALVGATNRPDKVDEAIKSRFKGNIVEFTEPPEHIKHEILLDALRGDGVVVDCARKDLACLSYDGLVGRELETAARQAIRSAADRQANKPYRVISDDVQQAVTEIQERQDQSLASQ